MQKKNNHQTAWNYRLPRIPGRSTSSFDRRWLHSWYKLV